MSTLLGQTFGMGTAASTTFNIPTAVNVSWNQSGSVPSDRQLEEPFSMARLSILGGSDLEFKQVLDAIRRELSPQGLIEALMVDQFLVAVTRLRRAIQQRSETVSDDIAEAERTIAWSLGELDKHRQRDSVRWGTASKASSKVESIESLTPLSADDQYVGKAPESQSSGQNPESFKKAPPTIKSDDDRSWCTRLCIDENVSDEIPVIKGTWVTTNQVVSLLVDGWSWDDILRHYPELTELDIRACLNYSVEQDGPIKV